MKYSALGRILAFSIFLCFINRSFAQPINRPDTKSYSALFKEGKLKEAAAKLDLGLASGEIDFQTVIAWKTIHGLVGDINSTRNSYTKQTNELIALYLSIDSLSAMEAHDEMLKVLRAHSEWRFTNVLSLRLVATGLNDLAPGFVDTLLNTYLISDHPNFNVIRAYASVIDDQSILNSVRISLKANSSRISGPIQNALGSMVSMNYVTDIDKIALTKTFIKDQPNDCFASRFLADRLFGQKHYEEAAAAYKASFALDPFTFEDNLYLAAKAMTLDRNESKADSLITAYCDLYNSRENPLRFDLEKAKLLKDCGNYGLALDLINKPEENPKLRWNNIRLHAEIYDAVGKTDSAKFYYLRLVDSMKATIYDYAALIALFNKDSANDKRLKLASQARQTFPNLSETFYYNAMYLFEGLHDTLSMLENCRQWNRHFPYSTWQLDNYSLALLKGRKYDSAIKILAASIRINRFDNSWRVGQLLTIYSQCGRKFAKAEVLDSLLLLEPSCEEMWNQRLALETASGKAPLLKKEAELNPLRTFPYNAKRGAIRNNNDSLLAQLAELEKQTVLFKEKATPGEIANIYEELAFTYVELVRKTVLPPEEARKGIDCFNEFDNRYGSRSVTFYFMPEIYTAMGEKDSAKHTMEECLKYRPDESQVYWDLWTIHNDADKVQLCKQLVRRNPYNDESLADYIKLNAMWNGSALEAVVNANIFAARFPNSTYASKVQNYKSQSLSHLGDNLGYYLTGYKSELSLAQSDRYQNWYTSCIRSLRKGSNKVVLDSNSCSATIYFDDGTEARYGDDCNCGKVSLVQVGPTYIQFSYDSRCDLTGINASDGYNIKLSYDEKRNITVIKGTNRDAIRFIYNSRNKPIQIIVKTDTLSVTYKENGEVESTKSHGGRKTALQITSGFQDLLAKIKIPQKAMEAIVDAQLPDLGMPDKKYDSLSNKFTASPDGSPQWLSSGLAFCKYLKGNLRAKSSYGVEALETISGIFNIAKNRKEYYPKIAELIDIYYSCLLVIRKSGVAVDHWNTWIAMQEWLKKGLFTERNDPVLFKSMLASIDKYDKYPIVLISESKWLQKSDLKNTGFWREISLADIIPFPPTVIQPKGIYYDDLNNIWLATNKGLFIENYGRWEHFAYDAGQSRFTRVTSLKNVFESSSINDIKFISDSITFFATNDGLYKLSGDIHAGGKTEKIATGNGLSSNIVNTMEISDNLLFVGTASGLDILDIEKNAVVRSYFRSSDISVVRFHESQNDRTEKELDKPYNLLVGNRSKSLYGAEIGSNAPGKLSFDTLYSGNFDFSCFNPNGGIVYSVKDKVYSIREDMGKKVKFPIELSGNIITTDAKRVSGMGLLPTGGSSLSLAVLTDRGVSIYRDKHFEHLDIPNSEGKLLPVDFLTTSRLDDIALVSGDRICAFEKSNITYTKEKVTDILTMDSLDMTIVASGGTLKYYSPDNIQPKELSTYSDATCMTKETDTSFIFNSGLNIVRIRIKTADHQIQEEELFECQQTQPDDDDFRSGAVKKILIDKKGNIWAVTGLSVFKYNKAQKDTLVEFNFFKNPKVFPSYTHMIHNIVETIEGKIWVVCSNEGHLYYKNVSLRGGLLQWNKEKQAFDNLVISRDDQSYLPFNWFIDSYTPIDSNRAILGTAYGFAEDYLGYIRHFNHEITKGSYFNDSYMALQKEHPSLFLSTRGVSIGNVWLFGSASGVVCYTNGVWLYPERFNSLLPDDQEYGQYGGRLINALSVDRNGQIFVGTDLGLMIYRLGSPNPMSFLFKSINTDQMLAYYNQSLLQNEKVAILDNIPRDSKPGKLLAQYNEAGDHITDLERRKSLIQQNYVANKITRINTDSLEKEQERLSKEQAKYLIQLEQQAPVLYQILRVPPLDIIASRSRLKDDECMVQYIPISNGIGIQFMSKQKTIFKEIRLNLRQFNEVVSNVTKVISGKGGDNKSNVDYNHALNYLYSVLIEPVQNNIEGKKNIYIIPFGALYYLPFNALSQPDEQGNQRYLIEQHNIGFISTISMFDLMYSFKPSKAQSTYMFADPDGSLPNAKAEVGQIKESIPGAYGFTGKDATVANLMDVSEKCKVLHLATHGHLEQGKIDESWLQFADKKLTMADIFTMNMANTEMVVLSACESASGARGLEYATLARAFSNAGVPTVVATLWDVNDYAAREITVDFYKNLNTGMNKFEAIATSQRNFIEKYKTTPKGNPYYWAPFIILGKP